MVRKLAALGALFIFAFGSTAAAGTKVLVVGDSHTVGRFGKGLLSVLDAHPDLDTAMAARCSSRPEHWLGDPKVKPLTYNCGHFERGYRDAAGKRDPGRDLKGLPAVPSVSSLVAKGKPDVVAIALGTNQIPKSDALSLEPSRAFVDRLLDQAKAGGARCIWVGPPNEPTSVFSKANQDRLESMLRAATRAKGCLYIGSRDVTNAKDTAADRANHIHYFTDAGTKWGEAIGGKIVCDLKPSPQNCGGGGGSTAGAHPPAEGADAI